ncbi:MAG: hypothetical protein SRB2_01402 [Desulfobacteraceae bacterium Eth-SRB2]|nr:MAG: hypothetical protein SRB2_01402 [Desulfobacteraceae bacterium Eth-SRB2]
MNSSVLLSITTFTYGLAAFLYIASWVFKKPLSGRLAFWVALIGVVGNTAGIIMRWVESYRLGIGHAPLSNMYESLVFFSWTIVIIYLVIERQYKNAVIGAFATPIAFLAMAYASMSPNVSDRIQPLIPALKSNWLIAHVITCFLGYAGFAVAFCFSLMYLVRTLTNLNLFSIQGRLARSKYLNLNIIMLIFNSFLAVICLIVYKLISFKTVYIIIAIFFLLLIQSLQLLIYFFQSIKRLHDLDRPGSHLLLSLIPIYNIYFNLVLLFKEGTRDVNQYGHPDQYSDDTAIGLLGILPIRRILDELTHQMVMFGFLFLSIGIITGAVWANSAWGSYWSWDPKETWSLITWFVYATFLHARMMRGWSGKRIAYLSILGFMAVIFTYFGVNLLPGLHSYGLG